MNENLRVSDADRERVAERLREHFADGRLTADEFDERLSAALNAKTVRDLRGVLTDLPEPATVPAQAPNTPPYWAGYRGPARRRGPRLLPLLVIALLLAVALPSAGWLLFAVLKLVLIGWLVICLLGIFAAARFRRHVRRHWQSAQRSAQQFGQPPGHWHSAHWQAGNWQQASWQPGNWSNRSD
jgi:hypothetical protein